MRFKVFLIALVSFILCVKGFCDNSVHEIRIEHDRILVEDFIGFGVQWSAYPWFDVSEEDWEKVFRRVDFMKMPFTRVMVDLTSFFKGLDENGKPVYDFNSPWMLRLYKLLDYCEKRKITVLIGQWGWANTALHSGGNWDIAPDSPAHAGISADFTEYLINHKKYSCIKWFDLINEPDGDWSSCKGDWDLWRRVAVRFHEEIKKRGLLGKITIAGPSDCFRGWIKNAVEDETTRNIIGIYNEHKYLWNDDVLDGKLERRVKEKISGINELDPGKRYFAGELGFLDGKNEMDQQVSVYEFWYGVSMADAAVQLVRAGAAGVIAWDLDDAMHWKGDSDGPLEQAVDAYQRRKIWGLWNIKGAEYGMPEDESPRPWFYTWSLLSRFFPRGSRILEVSRGGDLKSVAATFKERDESHLSIVIVNNSVMNLKSNIVSGEIKEKLEFALFKYSDENEDNRVDSWPAAVDSEGNDIYPAPVDKIIVEDSRKGIKIEVPPKSVIILTTLK